MILRLVLRIIGASCPAASYSAPSCLLTSLPDSSSRGVVVSSSTMSAYISAAGTTRRADCVIASALSMISNVR
jgi:hypothetical protein